MEQTPAGFAFVLLGLACFILFWRYFKKGLLLAGYTAATANSYARYALIGMVLWSLLFSAVGLTEVLADFGSMPPKPFFMIIIIFLLPFILLRAKPLMAALKAAPLHWLVYLQSFRILVEVILWGLYEQGVIPAQMTFEGMNWDIVSGLVALPVGYALQRKMAGVKLAWVYNGLGLILLFNILGIAILSMPTPLRQFMNEPANTFVAYFPYIWLPCSLVLSAFAGHVFSIAQLLKRH